MSAIHKQSMDTLNINRMKSLWTTFGKQNWWCGMIRTLS